MARIEFACRMVEELVVLSRGPVAGRSGPVAAIGGLPDRQIVHVPSSCHGTQHEDALVHAIVARVHQTRES